MFDKIKEAVQAILREDGVKRVDGNGWKAYAVGGNVIRIDLNTSYLQDRFQTTSE